MDDLFKKVLEQTKQDALRQNASAQLTHPTTQIGEAPAPQTIENGANPAQAAVDAAGGTLSAPNDNSGGGGWGADNGSSWADYLPALFGGNMQPVDPSMMAAPSTDTLKNTLQQIEQPNKKQAAENAVVLGPAKAIINTNDALREIAGDPNTPDKQGTLRKTIDQRYAQYTEGNAAASVLGGISTFVSGLFGASKLLAPFKAAEMGTAAHTAWTTAEGAVAGYFTMDPHEERLSNFIQQFPAFENPVNEFLSAKPDDTAIEGRFKNALEGIGMDIAASAAFIVGLRAIRAWRLGDKAGAKRILLDTSGQQSMQSLMDEMSSMSRFDTVKPDPGVREGMQPGLKVRVKAGSTKTDMRGNPKVKVQAGSFKTTDQLPGKAADDASGSQVGPITQTDTPFMPPAKAQPKEVITEADAEKILSETDWSKRMNDQVYGNRLDGALQSNNGIKIDDPSIPWQKLGGDDDVKILVSTTRQTAEKFMNTVKGGNVMTDRMVRAKVSAMTRAMGVDPGATVTMLIKAGKDAPSLIADMETSYTLSRAGFEDAGKVFEDIQYGRYAPYGGTREAAMKEFQKRTNFSIKMLASAMSISSNVGRGLRRMRSEFRVDKKSLDAWNSMTDEQRLKAYESTGGDFSKIRDLANPSVLRKIQQEMQFSMVNGLLWLYPSHIVNMTGNVFMQIARPAEKYMGSIVQSALRIGGDAPSSIRAKALREYRYASTSLMDGLKASLETAIKGDSTLHPHSTEFLSPDGASGQVFGNTQAPDLREMLKPIRDVSDLWHNAHAAYMVTSGIPTRLLGMQDEFFKVLSYRSTVQAQAHGEAEAAGLSGKQLVDFVDQRLREAFDSEGRAIDPEALKEAETRVFSQELQPGTLGFGLRNLRASVPALGFIIPFMKTPINVLRYAHKYTPLLNYGQKEYREALKGLKGSEAQAQAIGQMMMGTMFVGTAYHFASQGLVTGGGPKDPEQMQQLLRTGWRPYSYRKVNEDGTITFIPIGRFDPVGMAFGMVADIHHYYTADPDNRDIWDAVSATTIAIAKNFSQRTFLLNLNRTIDAIADPDNKMEKYAGDMAASMVPASSAMRGYINQDPYMREAQHFLDRIGQNIPGISEKLPPRRDVFGDPMLRRAGLTATMHPDPVDDELNRIILETGEFVAKPAPVSNGVDLREVTLPNGKNAYDYLQVLSANPKDQPSLKEAVLKLMNTPEYDVMVDGDVSVAGTKINAISNIFRAYHAAGMAQLKQEFPDVQKLLLRQQGDVAAKVSDNMGNTSYADQIRNFLGIKP